jgi:hypothetical protein
MRVSGIDKLTNLLTGLFIGFSRFNAEIMHSPMDVAVILFVIGTDGIDDLSGFLRRSRIIEINKWPLIDLLMQDGKIFPDFIDI